MTCTNPITFNGQLDFPCGKCMACRIQRTQEWAMRMVHEQMYHEHSLFVTLTYENSAEPAGRTVVPAQLINFIKHFRRTIEPRKLKYFANGEYGDIYKRPHYHLIMFGVTVEDFEKHPVISNKYAHKTWPYGFIDIQEVNYRTTRYVAGYIKRKLSGAMAIEEYKERHPPFKSASNGIGKQWALDNKEQIIKNEYIIFMNKHLSVPRYYCKILDIKLQDSNSERVDKQEKDFNQRYYKQKKKNDDEWSFNLRSKLQKNRNLQQLNKKQ